MTKKSSSGKPVLALLLRLLCSAAFVLPSSIAQAGAVFTSLHSFSVFTNGANPRAALVQGTDGNFYGTTPAGGTNGGFGTVFRISTSGALTSIYILLSGSNDGAIPEAGLVQGNDGFFYGTTRGVAATQGGGVINIKARSGSVFRISTNGVLTTLYLFTDTNSGIYPEGLVSGTNGYFYGTTSGGGTNGGYGTVFQISTNGGTFDKLIFFFRRR